MKRAAAGLIIAAFALCSCATLDRLRAGTPDVVAPSGAGIYWNGRPVDAAAVPMVERIYAAALATCPATKVDELRGLWTEVIIRWQADPFWCQRWVHGCNPLRATVDVSSSRVLIDELGHVIWQQCFGRDGEVTDSSGHNTYDPDFAAWVASVASAPTP